MRAPAFRLDDCIAEDNPVRVVDVFVDELVLKALDFDGAKPEATGRPGYHPATLLKIYIYGYLSHVPTAGQMYEWKAPADHAVGT